MKDEREKGKTGRQKRGTWMDRMDRMGRSREW